MLKDLYQQLVELAECFHPAVIDLHELFNRQFVSVDQVPHGRKLFLVIEQEPVFSSTRHVVQCKAHLTEKLFALLQLVQLGVAKELRPLHIREALLKAP